MNKLSLRKREFAGFLAGEGCFRTDKKKGLSKKRGWKTSIMYTPQINISLRDDDAEVLKWAKEIYGGTLIHRLGRPQIPNQNPYYMWSVNSSIRCLKIINDFLKLSFPSKKKTQAILLKELCLMKIERQKKGHKGIKQRWYTEKELSRQEEIYQTLKKLKLYVKQQI